VEKTQRAGNVAETVTLNLFRIARRQAFCRNVAGVTKGVRRRKKTGVPLLARAGFFAKERELTEPAASP
jgi:hypothetical protein